MEGGDSTGLKVHMQTLCFCSRATWRAASQQIFCERVNNDFSTAEHTDRINAAASGMMLFGDDLYFVSILRLRSEFYLNRTCLQSTAVMH